MPQKTLLSALLLGWVALRPVQAQETRDLYLPVVVNGYIQRPVHLQTMVRIVNLGDSAVSVVFEAYRNDGTATRLFELFPVERDGTRTVFEIPGRGAVEAFTLGDIPSFDGWARLTLPASAEVEASAEVAVINGVVGPHPICHRPSNEILATATIQAVDSGNYGSSFAVNRVHRQTALALVNPSTERKATVRFSLLDLSGNLVASGRRELEPQTRLSEPLSQLLDNPPADSMAVLWIQADEPISVATIQMLFPDGKFASAPVSLRRVACALALTPARNPLNRECVVFQDSCIPVGWQNVESCPE